MSAPSDASKGHSSEGHASACPQSEAQDVQKHVPPERGHPIHLVPREAHNRPIIIFVTTCAAKRRQILASASAHEAIVTAWCAASTWLVGRYVIMPDHIHLFCARNGLDGAVTGALDALLEISCDAQHGRAQQHALATSSLGPTVAVG